MFKAPPERDVRLDLIPNGVLGGEGGEDQRVAATQTWKRRFLLDK